MKHTLALNLVASLQKLHRHVDAMKRVNKILDADPTDAKALFRRSVSFLALTNSAPRATIYSRV